MGCDRTEGEKFLPRGGASIAPRRTLTRSSEKSRGKRASYIRGGSFPDARTPDGAYAATSRCLPTSRSANPLWYQQKTNSGDRKSVGEGKSVSVRVHLGGRGDIKKKTNHY